MMRKILARLGRMQQFAALRHRGFRMLWGATLLSSTARWADMVVVGWLTLELTDSALMVGIVAASKMAGYWRRRSWAWSRTGWTGACCSSSRRW